SRSSVLSGPARSSARAQEKGFAYTESMSAMNADDFLPIHIYVVVHSGLQRPYFAKEFLGAMIHRPKCWANRVLPHHV
ncbi:hypothetical protein SPRG_16942, partial [Saprolegnia parasitica CBS 223.65]